MGISNTSFNSSASQAGIPSNCFNNFNLKFFLIIIHNEQACRHSIIKIFIKQAVILITLTGWLSAQSNYSPEYNLWLPGCSNTEHSYSDMIIPPFTFNPGFNWQYVQLQTPYNFITEIFFVDSLCGWASHSNGGIHRTTDSGFNWIYDNRDSGGCICGVYFINQDKGWAVGSCGKIWNSNNGGANWIIQNYTGCTEWYRSVHFLNEHTGIITGFQTSNNFYGLIIRTTNRGSNWATTVLLPPDSTYQSRELLKQFWFDSNTGWICGYNTILKTTNGGLNFTDFSSNIPPTQNKMNAFLTVYFANEQTGWIGGSNLDKKNIYKTTNGGLNWFFQTNPIAEQFEYVQINDLVFLNADTGWAAHGTVYAGAIMSTTNGGANWVIDVPTAGAQWSLTKYNDSKIWSAGFTKVWYLNLPAPIGIIYNNNKLPEHYKLYQNYPNPFNAKSKIKYQIVKTSDVVLQVFDAAGRLVTTLVREEKQPGIYEVEFDGSGIASGLYVYKLKAVPEGRQAGDFVKAKKMVLLK